MGIRIQLSHFVAHLNEVKEKRRNWPHLDEVGWLTDNFSFDDSTATYAPMAEDFTVRPATDWFLRHARN